MTYHRVDVEIGRRIRDARLSHELSQTALGKAVGVSFQQMQKYEKGTNRKGASRLWMIGNALKLPMSYFFEGLGATAPWYKPADEPIPYTVYRIAHTINEMPDAT